MRCPSCGKETPVSSGRCAACNAPFTPAAYVAARAWTPPPDAPTLSGLETATHVADPLPSGGFIDTTGLPPSAGGVRQRGGPLKTGQAFGPRYHIIRLLGLGGMGAVYQAWDAELGVAVALKVIRAAGHAAELEARFKNELLLARQVTHKNVVRIHDLGTLEGIKYITMPYVEGDDLATLLRRGKLPIDRALKLARQIAAGLAAAHEAGVVHRDLKPANVMIARTADEEQAQIMDFGISASSSDAASGGVIGTLEYMAPEQAAGKPVDARADVYAFGVMLYEMLLGPRPQPSREQRVETMLKRVSEGLPPPRSIDGTVPGAVDEIVTRCIDPNPDARYANAAELYAALARIDDRGEIIPEPRRLTRRHVAAALVIAVAIVWGTYFLAKPKPQIHHDPLSVLIADFQNQTGDPAFDRSLESVLKLALEGAGFITAYDRSGVRALGGVAPARLDEPAALSIAVKQGVGVVVSGAVNRDGDGYGLSVKALQPVTGKVIATAASRASDKDKVLAATTKLATTVRTALGDETSRSSAQIFAMDTLSATNLDVVRQYAMATESMARARFADALQAFGKSVEIDPDFGMGYQGMALASRNLDRQEDAEKYIKEALRHLDRMTERERFRARGFFYRLTGDYQACVKEYGDLIGRYAADVAAHNQIALCSTYLRNWQRAVDEMRQVVKIVPNSTIFRNNLALYLAYSGDFAGAEEGAQAIENPGVNSIIALAFGHLGQGKVADALESYAKLRAIDAQGVSRAESGSGDVAIYEGRFAEAARMLGQGAAADLAANEPNRAAAKFAAVAYAQLLRKQNAAAIAAADNALKNSRTVKIRFLAARTLAEAGEIARAGTVAAGLAAEPQPEPQAHAKIIEGVIFLKRKDPRQAIKVLTEANALLDTWIGRFDLGRAYLDAGQYIQADSELDRCIKRRGEALSLFLEEEPTYGYLPLVYFYQGRVREGLNSAGFTDSYREYLNIRGKSTDDPLLPDVRRRAGH